MPYGASEAASVWASAPKGSRELPAFALQKPTSARRLSRAACGGSATQPLYVSSETHTRTAAASRRETPTHTPQCTTLLVASKPPTRRSVHIRAASSTRLKPRDGVTRFRRREQHLYQPPVLEKTSKPSTRRRDTSNKIPESNTKILKTAQDTPWTEPTSTKPPSWAMRRG